MPFAISATNDSLYNNVVMATYSGFTDASGTIDWGDGTTDNVIFPPAGQVTHQYSTTVGSPFTITAYDSGLVSQGTTTATVTSVTTRTQTEDFKRSGYHVEPSSIAATSAAFEATMPAATDAAVMAQVRGDAEQRLIVTADGKLNIGSGSAAGDTNLYRSAANTLKTDDNLIVAQDVSIATAGKGLAVKEGANARMGTLTLTGATPVVVSTTAVTATSRIFLTTNTVGGTPTGQHWVSARTAGTSFSVTGIASDTSVVAWMIVEPAA